MLYTLHTLHALGASHLLLLRLVRRLRLRSKLGARKPGSIIVDLVVGARLRLAQPSQVLLVSLRNFFLGDVILRKGQTPPSGGGRGGGEARAGGTIANFGGEWGVGAYAHARTHVAEAMGL